MDGGIDTDAEKGNRNRMSKKGRLKFFGRLNFRFYFKSVT
jgi:hypothetical protein